MNDGARALIQYHRARTEAEATALAAVLAGRVGVTALVVLTLAANDNEVPFGRDRLGARVRRLVNRFLAEAAQ